jgi:hypothetical protein
LQMKVTESAHYADHEREAGYKGRFHEASPKKEYWVDFLRAVCTITDYILFVNTSHNTPF